jgi:hypothetical protein
MFSDSKFLSSVVALYFLSCFFERCFAGEFYHLFVLDSNKIILFLFTKDKFLFFGAWSEIFPFFRL